MQFLSVLSSRKKTLNPNFSFVGMKENVLFSFKMYDVCLCENKIKYVYYKNKDKNEEKHKLLI